MSIKLVLDTNVVLDWLVFNDPSIQALPQKMGLGEVSVATDSRAIAEFERVLAYPKLQIDTSRQELLLDSYRKCCNWHDDGDATGAIPLPRGFPQCRDRDDQCFLHLAYRAQANALVSRDKQVLKLARKARRFGFDILNYAQLDEWLASIAR